MLFNMTSLPQTSFGMISACAGRGQPKSDFLFITPADMKRIVASLAVVAFFVGMIMLPTFHRLHCDDTATHHEANCPVCQLANAPLNTTDTHVAVVNAPPPVVACPVLYRTAFIAATSHDATQARAPPVA
jgi:hypothetical protein